MEYLCFANGRKKDECVRIYEGHSFMIDRLTIKHIDSDSIRKKYAKEFSEFQRRYPNGGKGSVRIYGDSVKGENGWRVLYQKHRIAFDYIIKDKAFLRWFATEDLRRAKNQRIMYSMFRLNGIAIYHKETARIGEHIKELKANDRKEFNVTGGARRYYQFMRDMLRQYEAYCEIKPTALKIDDIWRQYLEAVKNIKLQRQPIMDEPRVAKEPEEEPSLQDISSAFDYEIDPDHIYLAEAGDEREPLFHFFQSDHFERYYMKIFVDDEMMILGDFAISHDPDNISLWANIANTCFNGNVTSADLAHFSPTDLQTFESSCFVVFIGEADTLTLKSMVIRALENKAQVILISDDKELLKSYSKKFKSIMPIFNNRDDNYDAQKAFVDFFIEQYQNARDGYSKK